MLESHATLVDHLTDLLTETETRDVRDPALGPDLRPPAADALAEYAEALRALEASTDATLPDPPTALREAVDRLRREVREQRSRREGDLLAAGALVLALDRAVRAVSVDAESEAAAEKQSEATDADRTGDEQD